MRKRHFGDARVLCGEGDRGGEGAALSSSRVPQMSRVICDRTWDVIREPRPTETGSADVAPQGPKLRSLHPPPDASTFPPCNGNPDYFRFEVVHRSTKSNARVGRIHTPHGVIETPGFVAVGTMGALKHVSHQSLQKVHVAFPKSRRLFYRSW